MHRLIASPALLVGATWIALGPSTYEIGSFTIDGGGGSLSGATYTLTGTVGQSDAGPVLLGPTHEVTGGFWMSGSGWGCLPDLAAPFGVLDFSDVLAFLTAFGSNDPSADFAEPLGVFDFSDIIVFLSAFGAGCP